MVLCKLHSLAIVQVVKLQLPPTVIVEFHVVHEPKQFAARTMFHEEMACVGRL